MAKQEREPVRGESLVGGALRMSWVEAREHGSRPDSRPDSLEHQIAAKRITSGHTNPLLSPPSSPLLLGNLYEDFPLGLPEDEALDSSGRQELQEEILELSQRDSPSMKELLCVLRHPESRQIFYNFLCKSFCQENLEFWVAVERLKHEASLPNCFGPLSQPTSPQPSPNCSPPREGSPLRTTSTLSCNSFTVPRQGLCIMERFLSDSAPMPINIDYQLRSQLLEVMEAEDMHAFVDCFAQAQSVVCHLMFMDSYTRFRNSASFKSFLEGNSPEFPALALEVPTVG
jgi:hypothetical protein